MSWGQRKNQIMRQQSPLKLCLVFGNDKSLLITNKRMSAFRSIEGNVVQEQSMM